MIERDDSDEPLIQENREDRVLYREGPTTFDIRGISNTPPPPYEPSDYTLGIQNNALIENGALNGPTVVCRVCQQLVYIRGREGQRVVKCMNCHEATPIKAPPEGKKYIRCPCNALLTCRSTSTRISCPRQNCKRVINVGGIPHSTISETSIPLGSGDSRVRVSCGHCKEIFMFRQPLGIAKCPYCRQKSSIGSAYSSRQALISAILGIIFLFGGIGLVVGTMSIARTTQGVYVSWAGVFTVGIMCLLRSIYCFFRSIYCWNNVSTSKYILLLYDN
ncbi:type 2 phosphatidylinositol 4,5-bisphosphate 4-phosphatase isoform X1 [Hydra vulgaris]|uniref:type 2 phosphatidylinositol 4,5-bisphosphate 4-phosphatase isoform X1 n=1 Tax=Hydra vulgaris TaxID=6087 RepID=UPI0006410876|nr:type 2 phosphatidylinositol 4,5-bisphosphate 4-phosphatase isoform X1 [Hydra vulgaris]